jgi:hypothetical protein
MREAIGRLEFWEIAAVYPAAGRYIAIPLALVIGVGIGVVLLANGAVLPGIIALTILLPVLVGVAHLAIQVPFLAMGVLTAGVFVATRALWKLEGTSLREFGSRLRR